jgi:hypothetical protein
MMYNARWALLKWYGNEQQWDWHGTRFHLTRHMLPLLQKWGVIQ